MYKVISVFLLLIIFTAELFPQSQVKQITFNDSLSRNVSFYSNQNYLYIPYILYEVYNDTSVNINQMVYESAEDTFVLLPPLTSSDFQSKNPIGIISGDTQYVFYQTNQTGNWDIVCKYSTSSGWSDEITVLATPENEEKPKFVQGVNDGSFIYLICRQGDNILFVQFTSGTVKYEEVFSGSQYGGDYSYDAYYDMNMNSFYVAVNENMGVDSRLVYKSRHFSSTEWSLPIEITSPGRYSNPIWYNFWYETNIFYSKLVGEEYKIFLHQLPSGDAVLFDSLAAGQQSRLGIAPIQIITESQRLEYFYGSFAYRQQLADSTFVRIPEDELFERKSVYTKVHDINPGTGFVGWDGRAVMYCIWEDSTENSIQLFGNAVRVSMGDVNDYNLFSSYKLEQNYPNPFNPATKISYYIPEYSKITIKVFDILGNEITTLVNEEKFAGTYEVNWNTAGLSSGVYFYQLRAVSSSRQTGGIIATKKMILMK